MRWPQPCAPVPSMTRPDPLPGIVLVGRLASPSLSYLGSDERYGTDEAELSVNLPVVGAAAAARPAVGALSAELDDLACASASCTTGLIREAVVLHWPIPRRRFAADKRRLLLELARRQQEMVAASAASQYSVLLLQLELVQVELAQQDHLQAARLWLERYRQVSRPGLAAGQCRRDGACGGQFQGDRHATAGAGVGLSPAPAAAARRQRPGCRLEPVGDGKEPRHRRDDEQQYGLGLRCHCPRSRSPGSRTTGVARGPARVPAGSGPPVTGVARGSWEQLLTQRDTLQQKQSLLERSNQLRGVSPNSSSSYGPAMKSPRDCPAPDDGGHRYPGGRPPSTGYYWTRTMQCCARQRVEPMNTMTRAAAAVLLVLAAAASARAFSSPRWVPCS